MTDAIVACCERMGWTPNQVRELTPAQLLPFCVAGRKHRGSTKGAEKELKRIAAERTAWAQQQLALLTPDP